ncbi:hypothetical protein C8R47DRAFT_1133010 [Mycena vitilis]|nr:hypothetical protein C8R47DRAFT_1133010 [Mycena vitilis]
MFSTLNLVCRRVKEWAEPFKMECVFLTTTSLTRHPLVCKRSHSKWQSSDKLLELHTRVAHGVRGIMLGWHRYRPMPSISCTAIAGVRRMVDAAWNSHSLSRVSDAHRTVPSMGFDPFHALDSFSSSRNGSPIRDRCPAVCQRHRRLSGRPPCPLTYMRRRKPTSQPWCLPQIIVSPPTGPPTAYPAGILRPSGVSNLALHTELLRACLPFGRIHTPARPVFHPSAEGTLLGNLYRCYARSV